MSEDSKKNDAYWREKLTDEEFDICRNKGTERPFTGKYWNEDAPGVYTCKCCGDVLFESKTKYDAGCGWPSFYQTAKEASIKEVVDHSKGMTRIEVICDNCGSHLGHVFPDGPEITGMRYCINSASLDLKKEQ